MNQLTEKIVNKFQGVAIKEHSPRRIYVEIDRDKARELAEFLFKEEGMRLSTATGMDTRKGFELLYHFSLDKTGVFYTMRVFVPKDDPKMPSIASFLPAADWIEREMHELLGVEFEGHPNLQPLLTDEELVWEKKQPLRKYK